MGGVLENGLLRARVHVSQAHHQRDGIAHEEPLLGGHVEPTARRRGPGLVPAGGSARLALEVGCEVALELGARGLGVFRCGGQLDSLHGGLVEESLVERL